MAELQEYLSSEDVRRKFFYKTSGEEKAEFINGEIVVHGPVQLIHNNILASLSQVIIEYVHHNKLGLVGYEKLMIRLTRNDYEPDLCFFPNEKANGFTPDQKLFPVPEWIAEVLSESTQNNDRRIKMEDYAAHGVKEYWLVEPQKQLVEQYYLKFGSFFLHRIYNEGEVLRSAVFDGLQLPIDAIFNEDANKQYRKQFF